MVKGLGWESGTGGRPGFMGDIAGGGCMGTSAV